MIPKNLQSRLNLVEAVSTELASRNRLMPRRPDYVTLASEAQQVAKLLAPYVQRQEFGTPAGTVLVDKNWRGTRPINEMTLVDRVTYRALVNSVARNLPEHIKSRDSISDFHQQPLDVEGTNYVTQTDVAAYYEFVDHDLLEEELIAQTGDVLATQELIMLLRGVMTRRVGIPQVHQCSDILGDVYIDPVRRRMIREGYDIFSYSDDFRISSPSLASARLALERCAEEVRRLGLVLNERKTFTYEVPNYRKSLDAFVDAERRLFEAGESSAKLLDLDKIGYSDDPIDDGVELSLSDRPIIGGIDLDEAVGHSSGEENSEENHDPQSPQARAARQAWQLWLQEDESEDTQSRADAAITQSLVDRSLARLGMIGNDGPLRSLSALLRYEPALTPQVTSYLRRYAVHGKENRAKVRDALDRITAEGVLSNWQSMWIAEAAGSIRKSAGTNVTHYEWLQDCLASDHSGLAATAAAAIARLGIGDARQVARTIDRVSPEWRLLLVWALARIDRRLAETSANSALERLLIQKAQS